MLLRRLANPHLPFDNRPTIGANINAGYNPYVTIDYMRNVMPMEANSTFSSKAVEYSTAKSQPYAAGPRAPYQKQAATGAATVDTFGSYNTTTYNWLVHLDRQLVSPMEADTASGSTG